MKEDCITFKASEGHVESLGIHKLKGKGNVKYTIIDNNGDNIKILVKNTLYVPTLYT